LCVYNATIGKRNVQSLTALFTGAKIWATGFSLSGALGVLATLDIK
jgi:hypothetical protein